MYDRFSTNGLRRENRSRRLHARVRDRRLSEESGKKKTRKRAGAAFVPGRRARPPYHPDVWGREGVPAKGVCQKTGGDLVWGTRVTGGRVDRASGQRDGHRKTVTKKTNRPDGVGGRRGGQNFFLVGVGRRWYGAGRAERRDLSERRYCSHARRPCAPVFAWCAVRGSGLERSTGRSLGRGGDGRG